ncbi:MAG TPA: adenylate/guanylate cyclase domain-containing protein [Candidatus Limnocylindria bacterium]|nr:adenylate/guanylate cyclase domain-containing protein [Candidatus Limnocylindria bacterium]
MICTSCGTENQPGAKFCSECATPLATACPNCGTANPPAAKFCSECATPLQPGAKAAPTAAPTLATTAPAAPNPGAPPAEASDAAPAGPVAERRLVSILFADLVGFTTFAEGRDSEDVRETLSRYFDLASEVIGRYGGTVEKFIGDAVMAVWGAPIAREDDAERAVRAGLELVDAVPSLGEGIQARAGVLTGEAAVTIGAVNQGMVAGDIVNTASRLQSAADPGVVLVGETTQRAAVGAIVFETAGDRVMKGKQSPVPAWRAVRVVAERGGRNRSDALEAPFVGRDDELRLLKDLFHATEREGKARLISVIGPGGIGKSRLSWEFQKYGDGLVDNVWWHAGRSPAYGEGITFWALGEMVRRRAGLAETDDEATTRERVAASVAQHVPDEAEGRWVEAALLALLGVGGGGAPIGSDQLFAAWRTFFERMAATSPVVMVFEDLHHADTGLLDFIDHLMEWSRGAPITVITLARPELLERRPGWGAGKRSFTSVYLEPLPPADMERLLAGLVPGLPKATVDRIVNRADGIPLYAVETVRMLLAQGQLIKEGEAYRPTGDLDDLAVPETLTALIAARLDALDAADRALIEDAAVLGQSFTLSGLAAVSGQDANALETRLRALVRRELLVLDMDPRSPERGQYAFVQALIREVAYNTLSRKDRKARHVAAARHFESLATDELAGGLAGHYLAAQRLAADEDEANALAAQARIALRGAAERAAALGAYEQARNFLEQALEVTTDPAGRAELHERAVVVSLNVLDLEPLIRHAAGAEEERRKSGDREAIATAVALHAQSINTALSDPKAALAMLEAAWAEFSDLEETQAGVHLMASLMRAYRGLADNENARAWADRLLPIAERLGDLPSISRGLQGRGVSLAVTGRPREGLILLRGAHQLALSNDLHDVELSSRILLTFYEQWGEPAVGLALGREGLEIGHRLGSRAYGFQMVGNSVICALRIGEWDWAATILEEWLEQESDDQLWIEFRIDRALLHAQRGLDPSADIETAARRRAGVTDPQYESYELFARAVAALATGDLAAAVEHAERSMSMTDYFTPLAIPLAARAALWAADVTTARRLLEVPAMARFWGPVLEADRARIRAGIAALEGRTVESISLYREAIRSYRALSLRFEAAMAAIDVATVLPAQDRSIPEIEDWLDAARRELDRLGARPFADRLATVVAPASEPKRGPGEPLATASAARPN